MPPEDVARPHRFLSRIDVHHEQQHPSSYSR
jgi:hypothetical protein